MADKCSSQETGLKKVDSRHLAQQFCQLLTADGPFPSWDAYRGVVCHRVCFHGASMFLHNKTNKAQEEDMESSFFSG